MSTTVQRTHWALDLFRGFIESWAPQAMHGHLLEAHDNDGARVRSAIRAIAPQTDEERHVGWAVFKREPDFDYDHRLHPSGLMHTIASAVFEDVEQAQNALAYQRSKHPSADFVACEVIRVIEAR